MAFQLSDRVRETNVITGTGNVTLGGTVAGFRTFASQMANGDTTWYALVDNTANAWEVGIGTWNTGNTLSRTTVLASSNSGSIVTFAGNSCDCFMDLPASVAKQSHVSLSATGMTANAQIGAVNLPANGFLLYALIRETAGHAVDVSIGSTLAGSDVMGTLTVPASGTITVPIGSFLLGWFSATTPQSLFLTSASWGSASLNISLVFQAGP